MIYLASPYSHPDPEVVKARFLAACRAAGELMRDGELVYSPIAHTHPIAMVTDLPTDWHYWEALDRAFLERCDQVIVLMLDGWLTSTGVNAEIDIALELGIPVTYMEEGALVQV